MVEKVKSAGVKTGHSISNAFEVVMLAATTAVAVKAASNPSVHTAQGNLPIWQVAAALVLAGVAYKLYELQSK
jgi:hypothetical protein